jgi:CHASE2 domain
VKHLLKLLPVEVPVSVDAVLASGSSALGIAPPHGELQVTLVDIDEALYASWGRPCITPRDRLQEVIAAVADRHPAAIVVDVNLGCGDRGAALGGYLEKYAGPAPLILVRGLHVEQDPSNAVRQQVRMDATPYDDAVAANRSISWGHTFYSTDEDGTVRRWRDWWEACTDTGTATVPALPLRLLAVLPRGAGGAPPPQAPEHRGDCGLESQASPERIEVVDPRERALVAAACWSTNLRLAASAPSQREEL